MEKIQVTARFKIHKGKLNEFKEHVTACIVAVEKNEKGKGALQYDWFFYTNETECVVRETYANSDAVMAHMGNVGEPLGKILAISDFELELYGNLSEQLQQAASALNPKVYSFYNGI